MPSALAFAAEEGAPNDALVIMIAEQINEAKSFPVIRAVEGQLGAFDASLKIIWIDELPTDLPSQIEAAEQAAVGFDAVAVFWCNLDRPDRIYLYFAAPKGGRVLVRELAGSEPGGISEALAIIVGSSVQAAVAGGEIGTVVPPKKIITESTSPTQSIKTSSPEEYDSIIWRAKTALVLDIVAADHGLQAGLLLDATITSKDWWSWDLGYIFFLPTEFRTRGLELQLRRHPVFVKFAAFAKFGALRIGGSLAAQVDFVAEQKTPLKQGVSTHGDNLEVIISATPMLEAAFSVSSNIELFLELGADIPFNGINYTISTEHEELMLLDYLPLRPRMMAGLSIKL